MHRKKKPGPAAPNEKMLGRKQSIKGDQVVLADYGPEESLNETADSSVEWVNKVMVTSYEYIFQIEKYLLEHSPHILFPFQLGVRRLMRFCALCSLTSVRKFSIIFIWLRHFLHSLISEKSYRFFTNICSSVTMSYVT
jgi:hypothetical protein